MGSMSAPSASAPTDSDAEGWPLPSSFPPPRPLMERVRDYGAISGGCGAVYGAMAAARQGVPMLGATVWIGGHWAVASSCFLGVRALLIQDDWANDREGVSGMAAAIVGGSFAGLHAGRRAALPVSAGCFAAGFTLHYAHRWCAPHPSRPSAV